MSNLSVSVSPHIRAGATTRSIMLDVLVALVPAGLASILIFGPRALLVMITCVFSCVLFEWVYQRAMKKPVTVSDSSAVVTGVILAYNLPVNIPLWQVVFGSAVAIILIKQLFGGLGKNFANPAVTARIVMILAFSVTMTTGMQPFDGVSSATPLALLARGDTAALPSLREMLLGIHGGSLGETCTLALLLGGAYLMVRRVITWHTPVAFIATDIVFTWMLGHDALYHALSGGLIIGAVFMATDYVTTPHTASGRLVFGVGAGLLTVIFRVYGSSPEGVSFAILLMNILTPYINKLTESKPLGAGKEQ